MIIIENFRYPRVVNDNLISCDIEHPIFGWMSFSCPQNFDEGLEGIDTNDLYQKLLASPNLIPLEEPGPLEPPPSLESVVRRERDIKLRVDVDPVVSNPFLWNSLSTELQNEWIEYRTLLLDITLQEGFPEVVSWPLAPNSPSIIK